MRKFYFVLLLHLFFILKLQAQGSNDCTYCNFNLSTPVNTYLTDELSYSKPGSAFTCTLDNQVSFTSIDVPYFDTHYHENHCTTQDNSDYCVESECILKIHVYYPTHHNYTTCPLPAIILFHGGAYNECGDYNDGGLVQIAEGFAERGFVAFNVNYRVGVIPDPNIVTNSAVFEDNQFLNYVSAQQMLAIYRATQDARGAIRSIIKMNQDGTFLSSAHPYKIDEGKIFVGGVSAGSLIALAACLFGDGNFGTTRFDQICPGLRTAMTTSTPNLGLLDPPMYYANRADISYDFHTHIAGIFNCWGGLFVPTNHLTDPYNFYKGQGFTIPPIISFCGRKDPVFDYTHQGVYFSVSGQTPPRDNETRCVPQQGGFSVQALFDTHGKSLPNAYCLGSQDIYQMLKTPGTGNTPQTTEFYLDCDMYHGLDMVDDPNCDVCGITPSKLPHSACVPCGYLSNFGGNFGTAADTYNYIVGRAATFFQTIQGGGVANITETKFVECVNNRVTCTGVANSGCDQNAVCPQQ